MKQYTLFKWLTIIWMLFILVASLISGNKLPSISISHIDKIGHLVCYAILAFLLLGTFRRARFFPTINNDNHKDTKPFKTPLNYTLIIAISYGVIIEILQGTLFLHRNFEIPDIIANIIGAFIGIISYKIIFKFLNDTV